MLLMHANNREDVKEARAGDIVALAGLKSVTTGDTLCDPDNPVILEKMDFPEPVIELAIEPKSKADQEKLGQALGRLVAGRSDLPRLDRPGDGPDRHQGHGRAASRDQGRHPAPHYKVDANVGAPQVAYRETLGRKRRDRLHPQEADRRFGPVRAHQARVRAGRAGLGLQLREQDRRRLGAEGIHSQASKRASRRSRETGVLAGFPVIDFKATLIDGNYHDVDFERAGLRDRRARGVPRRPARRRSASCSSRS